jgi:transposase
MPTPIPMHLSSSEKRALQDLQKSSRSRRIWARTSALLMLDSGVARWRVAKALSITPTTLSRWKQRWLRHGLRGLADAPRSGRPRLVTRRYITLMLGTVLRDPRELGYAFVRWTAPRLAEFLFQETGIRICPEYVRTLLARYDIVWRRTKRTIRNLPDRQALGKAKKSLERLKRGLCAGTPTTNSSSAMEPASTSSR